MPFRRIRVATEPRVLRVTLARPEAGNAFDDLMTSELIAALEPAVAGRVDVLVIDADGPDFCAGSDDHLQLPFHGHPAKRIARVPGLVIVAVAGRCNGLGLELAVAADLRLGDETASFSADQLHRRSIPTGVLMWRLPRIVGQARALQWLLTGEKVDARAAIEEGLLADVVPIGGLDALRERYVETLLKLAPLALRYTKESIIGGSQMSLERALDFEANLNFLLQSTDDREEGLTAARERRPPRFKGQ